MSFIDSVTTFFGNIASASLTSEKKPIPKNKDADISITDAPPIMTRANRRATVDTPFNIFNDFTWIEPGDDDTDWRLTLIDEETLPNVKARDLIKMLVNASPDVDRALHDFLRYCNSSWELRGENDRAQKILDDFLKQLEDIGQSLNVKIEMALSGSFTTGAFFLELVFDEVGRKAVNLAVIDPMLARYRRVEDPVHGQIWHLGQIIDGEFISFFGDNTIIYEPVNPVVDSPFGRPMINSAIFSVVFQLGLLKSTRQVVETQAWPKGIWKVDRKLLYETEVPPNKIDEVVESTKAMLENVWSKIKKTQAPIVGSEVSYEIVSAMNRASLSGVDMLERTLERWIIRALKTQPVLFGSNEGISEAHADVQLLSHGIFINSVQASLEALFVRLFTQVLRAEGEASTPYFRFARINAAERKREAEILRSQLQAYRIGIEGKIFSPLEVRRDFERADVKVKLIDGEEKKIERWYEATIKAAEMAALPKPTNNTDSGESGGGGNPPTSVPAPTNNPSA
jgi:hypothetical protein